MKDRKQWVHDKLQHRPGPKGLRDLLEKTQERDENGTLLCGITGLPMDDPEHIVIDHKYFSYGIRHMMENDPEVQIHAGSKVVRHTYKDMYRDPANTHLVINYANNLKAVIETRKFKDWGNSFYHPDGPERDFLAEVAHETRQLLRSEGLMPLQPMVWEGIRDLAHDTAMRAMRLFQGEGYSHRADVAHNAYIATYTLYDHAREVLEGTAPSDVMLNLLEQMGALLNALEAQSREKER